MKTFLICLVSIVATIFLVKMFEAENIDWSSYMDKQDERIQENENAYKELNTKIDTVYSRLNVTYEKIDSSSKPEFRNMLNNFAARTKGHNLPRGK